VVCCSWGPQRFRVANEPWASIAGSPSNSSNTQHASPYRWPPSISSTSLATTQPTTKFPHLRCSYVPTNNILVFLTCFGRPRGLKPRTHDKGARGVFPLSWELPTRKKIPKKIANRQTPFSPPLLRSIHLTRRSIISALKKDTTRKKQEANKNSPYRTADSCVFILGRRSVQSREGRGME